MDLSFGNRFNALELLHQMAAGEGLRRHCRPGRPPMKAFFAERFAADADAGRISAWSPKGWSFPNT
jgi:aldehyde:ferredoxin oxidoreductase